MLNFYSLDGFPSALLVSVMGHGEASAKVGSGMRSNRFGYYMKVVSKIYIIYLHAFFAIICIAYGDSGGIWAFQKTRWW